MVVVKMITESLFDMIFLVNELIINLFPEIQALPNWLQDTINIIKVPLSIFPLDVWITAIGSVTMWYGFQLGWAIVEWIYKKIPGVD